MNNFITNKCTNKIANYGTAYHIRLNEQNSVKQLITALYKDAAVSIARKQEKANLICEDNEEEDIVYSV